MSARRSGGDGDPNGLSREECEGLVRQDWYELVRLTLTPDERYSGERVRIDRRLCAVLEVVEGSFLKAANRVRAEVEDWEEFLVKSASTAAIQRRYPPPREEADRG